MIGKHLRDHHHGSVCTSTAAWLGLILSCVLVGAIVTGNLRGAQAPVEAPSPSADAPAEPPEATEAGLRGLFPPEVPRSLEPEEFEILAGNWSQWSSELAQLVLRLYEEEGLDVSGQRELLKTLRSKLGVMERALGDDRYRSIHAPLTTIHGRLVRRVDLAEAVLDTLELTPQKIRADRLQAAGGDVSRALSRLRRHLDSIRGGSGWLPFVRAEEIGKLMQTADDAEAAVPVFQAVSERLGSTEDMSEAQREFLGGDEFLALKQALDAYIEAANRPLPQVDEAARRAELARLVTAVERFEMGGRTADAEEVHAALAVLENVSPDGGRRVAEVVNRHFRNHNVRIVVSEELLSRYVEETRRESEPITDRSSDAYTTGRQTTTATMQADLQPYKNGGRFDLVLRGVVRASTVSRASRATIYASGNHTFTARRAVVFDGESFRLGPYGVISVDPNITITGANTSYDGGLFAGTARRRAIGTAQSRVPSSERTAARKIREGVLPEFDEEVEKEMAKANKDFETDWLTRLREAQIEPAARDISSTDRHLLWNSLVARGSELSGGTSAFPEPPETGLLIHVHETLLNQMFDRMEIAGRAMTEAEFRKVIDDYFAILTGKQDEPAAGTTDSTPATASSRGAPEQDSGGLYLFAEQDPVRFHVENGRVNLVMRTGFREQAGDEIPTQVITVPFTLRVEPQAIVIERGHVGVAPAERPESRFRQITRAAEMRDRIEKAIQPKPRTRKINVTREGKSDLALYVTRISALNGWMSVWAK